MADVRGVAEEFVEAFNRRDEGRIRELNSEDAVLEAPGDVRLEGREPATQYGLAWLRAFPDARITVRNQLQTGDWVVQKFTVEGTHGGTFVTPAGDVPATNRQMRGRGVQMLRVEGEAVAETRLYFDQVQVLTQLGLMPEPSTA